MFNFKAFFAALLFGIPWIFAKKWRFFWGSFTAMAAGVAIFIALDPNIERVAQQPLAALTLLSAPAFLIGFFLARKRPAKVFLRGVTTLVGGAVSWFIFASAVAYGIQSGIIPEWQIDYEAPVSGALAGDVDGHKRLSLSTARKCKSDHDELEKQHRKFEADLAAMNPRGEAGLREKMRLDRESNAIDEARSRNLSSRQNEALNARIRAYNHDARRWNAENQAYFAERDRLIQAISDSMLPPDEWYQRCTIKTSIHYDNYRQVCTMRDFGLISGGNLFCKNFPSHKRHMEKQIAKQIKARNARKGD